MLEIVIALCVYLFVMNVCVRVYIYNTRKVKGLDNNQHIFACLPLHNPASSQTKKAQPSLEESYQ